ncbi:MAG: hypothetical protein ACXWLT_00090 [Rhizomicrobium sp.]
MNGFPLDIREIWTLCSDELRSNSRAMKSSKEKRPFWYFVMAVGIAVIAVGVLAPGGRPRLYELAGGMALILFSVVRLLFLKGRRRRRRKRQS